MANIFQKKFHILTELLKHGEAYKGIAISQLEQNIYSLKGTLESDAYDELLNAFENYKQYLINLFASTPKVKVDLTSFNTSKLDDVEQQFLAFDLKE